MPSGIQLLIKLELNAVIFWGLIVCISLQACTSQILHERSSISTKAYCGTELWKLMSLILAGCNPIDTTMFWVSWKDYSEEKETLRCHAFNCFSSPITTQEKDGSIRRTGGLRDTYSMNSLQNCIEKDNFKTDILFGYFNDLCENWRISIASAFARTITTSEQITWTFRKITEELDL